MTTSRLAAVSALILATGIYGAQYGGSTTARTDVNHLRRSSSVVTVININGRKGEQGPRWQLPGTNLRR
jgi:TctA family transporter